MNMRAVGFESGLVAEQRTGAYRQWGKRAFESSLILLTAPITVPVVLLLALLIALDGGNPFFVQKRLGRGGRVFSILKLRTMVVNAEKQLSTYLDSDPAARAEWDASQKLKNDPRITRVGRLLRKTSLDELPQLLNVLNGTMALVGPRPMMVKQRRMYHGLAYYALRPGITGPWQISARNESEFVSRVRFDDEYCRRMSFTGDLRILSKTVAVVLRGTGY